MTVCLLTEFLANHHLIVGLQMCLYNNNNNHSKVAVDMISLDMA